MKIKINGREIEAQAGATILEAARMNGVMIPTLCYFGGLNEIGACRICLVEVKDSERLVAACNTKIAEGMEIETATKRVLDARKANLQLILSEHDCHCPSCPRNGNCTLQTLARNAGIFDQPYAVKVAANEPMTAPLIRRNSKCIKCMRCIQVCEKIQCMKVWDLLGLGRNARVGVRNGEKIENVNCTYCGQCITHCPVGALSERDDTERLLEAIADETKTVVLQVAPAVRAAWGDGLGLPPKMATEKRMAAAFRQIGVDYVFDTNFSADLTIMEEGNEFLAKMKDPAGFKRPMFTSCCPGWVRFMKLEYPEMVAQLSSAKSPQQMFGAVAKSYFAEKLGKDRKDIFCVSIMPCTAKKYECTIDDTVDLVLTTREVDRLIQRLCINVGVLKEEEFDSPLGTGSGAGVIFGATGGVMEAALRTAAAVLDGKNPDPDAFKAARGIDGRKELVATAGGVTVKACVVSGLANARKLVEDIRAGKVDYDFVEVMACPGGCAGGGGQPIVDGFEMAEDRGSVLYKLDAANKIRHSHENPEIQALYRNYLEKPLSHKAHELLHTDQRNWNL